MSTDIKMPKEERYGKYFIVEEPYYYVRVSNVTESDKFIYPDECGITTCAPGYCISNYTRRPYLLFYIKPVKIWYEIFKKLLFMWFCGII